MFLTRKVGIEMLGLEELSDLEDALSDELDEHLTEILVKLNPAGQLNDFLALMGLQSLLEKDSG